MNKDGYGPSTVRKAYMLLGQGMGQAVRDGYISKSPCDRKAVRLPKKAFRKPNALDERGRANVLRIRRGLGAPLPQTVRKSLFQQVSSHVCD